MILIVLGIYVKFRGAVLTKVLGVSSVYLFHVSYLCLVMGCLTVLLGFPVWYGTTKESREILLFVSWVCRQTPKLSLHVSILYCTHCKSLLPICSVHGVSFDGINTYISSFMMCLTYS